MKTHDAIVSYLEACSIISWPINEKLNKGISRRDVKAKLNLAGLRSAFELEIFWSLMNGVKDESGMIAEFLLVPGYYPLALVEALEVYSCRPRNEEIWPSNLFPFLQDGMGHFLTAEVGEDDRLSQCVFEHTEGYLPSRQYLSICDLFTTLREGIDRGIIFVKDQKFLDVDFIKYQELAAELNPKVDFWNT